MKPPDGSQPWIVSGSLRPLAVVGRGCYYKQIGVTQRIAVSNSEWVREMDVKDRKEWDDEAVSSPPRERETEGEEVRESEEERG